MIIDESHVTIPQLGGMYRGDRSRKENLVDYGFRLPSALDNRPLKFEEFEGDDAPDDLRLGDAGGLRADAVGAGRGAGGAADRAVDPQVEVRPASTQVDDLLSEINAARRRATSGCSSRRSPSAWRRI